MEYGDTTVADVAIWSNRIRQDEEDHESRGGGAILVRGAVFRCTAEDGFTGPDREASVVIANNTSELHLAGGVMLADSCDVTETTFISDGCSFGTDENANECVSIYAGFTHEKFDVAGLADRIECTREQCYCGPEGTTDLCPTWVPTPECE